MNKLACLMVLWLTACGPGVLPDNRGLGHIVAPAPYSVPCSTFHSTTSLYYAQTTSALAVSDDCTFTLNYSNVCSSSGTLTVLAPSILELTVTTTSCVDTFKLGAVSYQYQINMESGNTSQLVLIDRPASS